MLNTKKNLIQRVQIMMTALVLIIGLGGAFAANAPKANTPVTYAVLATNTDSYSVTTDLNGICSTTDPSKHCIIQSSAPLVDGRISKSGAMSVTPGIFTPEN